MGAGLDLAYGVLGSGGFGGPNPNLNLNLGLSGNGEIKIKSRIKIRRGDRHSFRAVKNATALDQVMQGVFPRPRP